MAAPYADWQSFQRSQRTCPCIRVRPSRTALAPSLRRGHGVKGHPWPSTPLAASMPLIPLCNDSTRPPEGAVLLPHRMHRHSGSSQASGSLGAAGPTHPLTPGKGVVRDASGPQLVRCGFIPDCQHEVALRRPKQKVLRRLSGKGLAQAGLSERCQVLWGLGSFPRRLRVAVSPSRSSPFLNRRKEPKGLPLHPARLRRVPSLHRRSGARREGPSMAPHASRSIHAARHPARRLRSAS